MTEENFKGIFPINGVFDNLIKFFRKFLYFCVKKASPEASELIIEYILFLTKDNF